MSRGVWGGLLSVVAASAGVGLAVAVGSAGADTQASTTTRLGSTVGTPNQNICAASINCTYVPFSSAANPGLQVPFDGTVTSFSVNSGSATGAVELRVLRPAANGKFTGAGASPAETLAGGPQTFNVSLSVKAGDVLALDNSTSALVFDGSTANPAFTAYYQPALAGGSTGVPNNNRTDRRLLLGAVVVSSGTTTTTTGNDGTTTVIKTVPAPPIIGNPTQSRSVWREGSKLASFARAQRPPVGTTFAFGLSATAKVTFAFRQRAGTQSVLRGTLSFAGHAGTDRLFFQGRLSRTKKLKNGRYTVTITAVNNTGSSRPATLTFTIRG
jgi:hypothetical protein